MVKLKLKTKIMLLVILILNLVLILVGIIIVKKIKSNEIDNLGIHAMDIAESVANIPTVAQNLGNNKGIKIIQPLADEIRKSTKADFVVVFDMNGIRYSHPKKDRLGRHIVGGDETRVLKKGESYISKAVGTLGPSMRAFVPIFCNNKQVGAVTVGILMKDINNRVNTILSSIYLVLLFGDILGIIGSFLLAYNVKKSIFGLEPIEIAKVLNEKNAIIDSIKEGLIAIDKDKKVTLINKKAKKMINYKDNILGVDVNKIIPNTRLPKILKTGKPEYNKEQIVNNTLILTNRVPVIIEDEVVGAVASFTEKNEVKKLAKELTGVKKFASALRSQNHEFMNKLHTISGLIQLGEYDNAIKIISNVTSQKQEVTSFIIKKIKLNEIAGLLLGKFDRAGELQINFVIDKKSSLIKNYSQDYKDRLITIIGNLIGNAMDSLDNVRSKGKKVYLGIFEREKNLKIIVKDSGTGISSSIQDKIFERGFSTKGDTFSGIGLYLVKTNVKFLGGDITFNSKLGEGTIFKIVIPYNDTGNEVISGE